MELFPWKELGIFLSYAITALLGVVVKVVWDATQELRGDLSKLREELARNYMPRVEIRQVVDDVLEEVRNVVRELKEHEIRERQWHKETVDEIIRRTHPRRED